MATTINFSSPILVSIEFKNNKLHLQLDWGGEIGNSIISRNPNGYNYKDIEYEFERFFKSPEFMIYEYNLPLATELLELLPILNERNSAFYPSSKVNEDIDNLVRELN